MPGSLHQRVVPQVAGAIDQQRAQLSVGGKAAVGLVETLGGQRGHTAHHRRAAAGTAPVDVGFCPVAKIVDRVCPGAQHAVGHQIDSSGAIGARPAPGEGGHVTGVDAPRQAHRLRDAPGVVGAVLHRTADDQPGGSLGRDEGAIARTAVARRLDEEWGVSPVRQIEMGYVARLPVPGVVVHIPAAKAQCDDLRLVAGARHAIVP